MKRFIVLLPFLFLLVLPARAQQFTPEMRMKHVYPFFYEDYLKYDQDTLLLTSAVFKGNLLSDFTLSEGERYVTRTKSVFTAFLKPKSLLKLSKSDKVISLEVSLLTKTEPSENSEYEYLPFKIDTSIERKYPVVLGGVEEFANASELKRYDGKGVVIAIIDDQMPDFRHPDFQNADGSSRFLEIWDQQNDSSKSNNSFGYGKVWKANELNENIAGKTDKFRNFGAPSFHITGFCAAAAGSGYAPGGYKGIAPAATLVFVKCSDGDLTAMIDACRYAFNLADSLRMPCVINIQDSPTTPVHDGSDAASIAISEMLREKPGRLVFTHAGNTGQISNHLSYKGRSLEDERFFWFGWKELNSRFTFKTSKNDMKNLEFSFTLDSVYSDYPYSTPATWIKGEDILKKPDDHYRILGQDGSFMEINIRPHNLSDSTIAVMTKVINYEFGSELDTMQLLASIRGKGSCDFWTPWFNTFWGDLRDEGSFNYHSKYLLSNNEYGLRGIAPARDVLTVGAFIDRDGYFDESNLKMASFTDTESETVSEDEAESESDTESYINWDGFLWDDSQKGGYYGGRIKPDFSAPGAGVVAAIPLDYDYEAANVLVTVGGYHAQVSSTESAAAIAAGMGALFLQRNPNATLDDFRRAIEETTDIDVAQGDIPNSSFGYGKINLYKLMKWEKGKGE